MLCIFNKTHCFVYLFKNKGYYYDVNNGGIKSNLLSSKTFIIPYQKEQPVADALQIRCSKNFSNIHRKASMLESLFNKVAGLRPATLLKKRLQRRCCHVNIAKFLRRAFFYRTPPVAASPSTSEILSYCIHPDISMGYKTIITLNLPVVITDN